VLPTVFISDLHLDTDRPAMVDAFEHLLARLPGRCTSLFILGDLFEAWVGDDDDSELATRVSVAFAELTRAGVRCLFQHGNRDFLLGERFAARAGLELLPESVVLKIAGTPTLLMHGDTLCTEDHAYLAFRRQTRDAAWQRAFLAQPLSERREFARTARAESARHTRTAAPLLMDVTPSAVSHSLRSASVRRLIHGHTHRPAIHTFELNGEAAERIVLGDWYATQSLLVVTSDDAELCEGERALEALG
jgi:UDP-2,3-diacylglucosamine hydrolase